jgi:hypothetical protein
VYVRCGCRGEHGRQKAGRCPRISAPGHGSWYYAFDLPSYSPGRRERIRRGGFSTRDEAQEALNRLRLPRDGVLGGIVTVVELLRHFTPLCVVNAVSCETCRYCRRRFVSVRQRDFGRG